MAALKDGDTDNELNLNHKLIIDWLSNEAVNMADWKYTHVLRLQLLFLNTKTPA